MKAKRIAFSLMVSLVTAFSGGQQAIADDTDIYTLPPKFSTDAAPKVLLIFDTSGSMRSDVDSRPAYDPSYDYVSDYQTVNPSTPLTANRIYWDNRTLNPPSHSSGKWIDVSELKCKAAIDYFATSDNVGYFGESSTSSLMVQHRSNSNRRWTSPASGSRQPIDCIQDVNASYAQTYTPLLSGESTYLNANNDNDGYTTNSNNAYTWGSTSSYYRVRLYTANYIAYLSNSSLTTTRARMRVAKEGLKAVMDDNNTVNFGLMAYNVNSGAGSHGGRVVEAVGKPDDVLTYQPTTVNTNASNGDTVLIVEDPRMFSVGEEIGIEMNGGAGTHWTTVASAPQTELTAFLSNGGTSFTVKDATGFVVGDTIGIEDNRGRMSWNAISAIAGNTITIGTAFSASGEDANETQKIWNRKLILTDALTNNANNGRLVYARGTRLQKIKDTIEILVADGSTPISESTYEAYRYFAGQTPTYGNPTSTETPTTDLCAQTNGCSNTGTYISPLRYECEKAYIVMMTDGAPTSDTDEQQYLTTTNFPAVPTTTGQAISSLPGSNSGDGLVPLVEWMNKNDIYGGLANTQTAKFYAVTFGDGISASAQTLLDNATKAGTGDPTKTATNAEDVTDLQNAFDNIIADIKIESASFGAPTLSVNAFNKLYNRDEVYFALFEPSAKYKWNGNLKKFRLCDSTDATNYGCTFGDIIDINNADVVDLTTKRIKAAAHSWWSTGADGGTVTAGGAGEATTGLNPDTQRRLYTWMGDYGTATFPLSLTQIDDASGNAVFDAVDPSATPTAGDPGILGLAGTATTTDVTNTIGWMMGKDVYDEDGDPGTTERWAVGDPLHSRPITITYGAHGGDYDQPVIKLLMAGNDGAVRMFNDYSGREEWAFVPQEMLGNQANLASGADGTHLYGVDNTATVWVKDHNNNGIIERPDSDGNFDTVYAYISMRRGTDGGGDSYLYALDITPGSTMSDRTSTGGITPEVLWVVKGGTGDFTQLGQTWSAPQVVTVRTKTTGTNSEERKVLLFGGGYDTGVENNSAYPAVDNKVVTKNNSGTQGNAIYMVDATTGSRVWWASSATATDGSGDNADLALGDMIYPIPSDLALLDSNGDQAIDRIYVGDVGGQVWRVDLDPLIDPSGSSESQRNGATKGYVFADLNCDRNATAPYARNCPATDVEQDWRRVFYAPDIGGITDSTYVLGGEPAREYDMVFVVSGDRPDPLDRLTNTALSPKEEPVHNAVYAFRDPNFGFGPLASVPKPIVASELHDATDNAIESADAATKAAAFTELRDGKGWMMFFKEATNPAWTATDPVGVAQGGSTRPWIGEKSLARPVLFGGVVYVTTFTPANPSMTGSACEPNEGLGRVYGLNYLDAAVVIDLDGDGTAERSMDLGGGIPSELVTVIREDGTTGLVGSSGGATQVGVEDLGGQQRTFWYQE
jgi:type IV pilus assembly protein PilY1